MNNMFSAQKIKLHGMTSSKWTTRDKLTQYRGLINLYNRDRKIIEVDTAVNRKKLERELKALQKTVEIDRLALDNATRGDKQQLRNTLAEHRELQLAHQNSQPRKVIESVHQINFTRRKVLDKLIYQNILKSKKLIELKMEQALFEDRLKYGFLSQIEQEKTAQIITGKVQDAMLKNEAALTIKQIYTEIIDIMKKDALYYDSIITTIENDGFSQSKCFLGAIRLGQLAMEYLDDRRQEYNTLKKIIMEDMTTRKLDIKMLQEQLKSAATTIKHLLRKESDINTCIVKLPDTPSMDALRKEAAEIESTLKYLKSATSVPTYEAIYPCLNEQLKQKKRLKIMAEKCERDRDNILNKINHAELANSVLKNTMIETTGNYKKRKKELIASINQLTKKIETNQVIVQNKNNLAANVRIALWQLLQLSKQIRLEREDKKKSILINLFTVDLENAPKEPERDENNAFKIIPILISRFTCLMSSYFEKLDESKTDEACKMYEAMMIDRTIEAEQVDKKLSPTSLLQGLYTKTPKQLTREDIKKQSRQIVTNNTVNDDLVPLYDLSKKRN